MTRAQVLSPTPENLSLAAAILHDHGVVGMPTETVYGLAGQCHSPQALSRIFSVKERPTFDPLIIHIGKSLATLESLEKAELIDTSSLSPSTYLLINQLMKAFWPGPLTLVLPKHSKIHDLATSGLPTVAIRMPKHPIAQALIEACGSPLAAPSANRFGRISPTSALDVEEELGDRIPLILDGGKCEIGLESTVLGLTQTGQPVLLRPGGIGVEKIEALLKVQILRNKNEAGSKLPSPAAPGMLDSHYAPKKPFSVLPSSIECLLENDLNILETTLFQDLPLSSSVGLLLMGPCSEEKLDQFQKCIGRPVFTRVLSDQSNLQEMAQRLFGEMRFLDSSQVSFIFSEPSPTLTGLGHAISDRLYRASIKPAAASTKIYDHSVV